MKLSDFKDEKAVEVVALIILNLILEIRLNLRCFLPMLNLAEKFYLWCPLITNGDKYDFSITWGIDMIKFDFTDQLNFK